MTLFELLVVVALLASLAQTAFGPLLRRWRSFCFSRTEQQIRGFFQELALLASMSESEVSLALQKSKEGESLVAFGSFFQPKISQISLKIEKGIHFETALCSPTWRLCSHGEPKEFLFELQKEGSDSHSWRQTLYVVSIR